VFDISPSVTVVISGLTIAKGRESDVRGGAGIYNGGTLTITSSTLNDNSNALPPSGGGAIYNTGTLTITGSTLSSNRSGVTGGGGSIYNGGALTVSGSKLISSYGPLTLTASTLSANTVTNGDGAGIDTIGTLTVTNSTFSGNSGGYGGGIYNGGTLTVTNSTFRGNSARDNGGGIYNTFGTVTVTNSTFSDNSATFGSGIHSDGSVTITSSTFSGNSASISGGGIYQETRFGGTVTVRNTILAGNTGLSSPDVSGPVDSRGHNLIGNGTGGSGYIDTDMVGTAENPIDPRLGPVQDNGGPTQTMALQCGSPAIDAGDNTDSPEWDQRGEGFPRIVNRIIDIGAYEVQEGECGGLAPHGSSDRLNRLITIRLTLDSPFVPASRVVNVCLSANLEATPIAPVSQSVAATPTPPERLSITRPPASCGMAEDSLFLEFGCSFEKFMICS
jgi:predicted outer membrane repeat protein